MSATIKLAHPIAKLLKDLYPWISDVDEKCKREKLYYLRSRYDDFGSHILWAMLDDTPYSEGDQKLANWYSKYDKIRGRAGLSKDDWPQLATRLFRDDEYCAPGEPDTATRQQMVPTASTLGGQQVGRRNHAGSQAQGRGNE
eukprot:SAG31_NODE_6821_length_1878_cov_1.327150_3_plen_142_part_00